MLQLIFLRYCGEHSWCIILEKFNVKIVGTKIIFTIYISILTSLLALSFTIFSLFDFCITHLSFETYLTCCSFVYGLLCQDRLIAVQFPGASDDKALGGGNWYAHVWDMSHRCLLYNHNPSAWKQTFAQYKVVYESTIQLFSLLLSVFCCCIRDVIHGLAHPVLKLISWPAVLKGFPVSLAVSLRETSQCACESLV